MFCLIVNIHSRAPVRQYRTGDERECCMIPMLPLTMQNTELDGVLELLGIGHLRFFLINAAVDIYIPEFAVCVLVRELFI